MNYMRLLNDIFLLGQSCTSHFIFSICFRLFSYLQKKILNVGWDEVLIRKIIFNISITVQLLLDESIGFIELGGRQVCGVIGLYFYRMKGGGHMMEQIGYLIFNIAGVGE